MTKKRRKKKSIFRSTFYRIYFAAVILCILGIVFGVRYLDGILADFESAQPVHTARDAARMFENADFETIYSLDSSVATMEGIDKAYYIESMQEIAAGRTVSWTEAYSPSEDEKVYRVFLDDDKFAEFSLVPSGKKTQHGNRLWKLDGVTTYVTIAEPEPEPTPEPTPEAPAAEMITCTITVPSSFKVVVDGKAMDANNVVTADIPTASAGLLPKGVPSPTLIRYAFMSETGAPVIEVTDESGAVQPVNQDSETDWSTPLPQNPELKEEFEAAVVKVAQRISSYSAKDASEGSVLQYCAKNSPARNSIKNFDNTWGTPHNGAKFENVVSSDYYMYSDSCFSCKVSFDYVARFSKSTIKTYPTTYTLYFIKEGGTGKLYNFTLY